MKASLPANESEPLKTLPDYKIIASEISGKKNGWLLIGGMIWLSAVVVGMALILVYTNSPARVAASPAVWPVESRISIPANRPMLIMFAHPHCPCTRASLGELEQLMTDCHGQLNAQVWFIKPAGTAEDWTNTDLWCTAAGIPGVTVYCDDNGMEARRFHATASGQTLLYVHGHLLFQGGITISRGHAGDNPGLTGLEALVEGKLFNPVKTPVFGCSLFDDQCRQN